MTFVLAVAYILAWALLCHPEFTRIGSSGVDAAVRRRDHPARIDRGRLSQPEPQEIAVAADELMVHAT